MNYDLIYMVMCTLLIKRNQWNYDYISYVKEHVGIKLNELWKDNIYVLELDLELD